MNQATFFDDEHQADLEGKRKVSKQAKVPKSKAAKLRERILNREGNRLLLAEWFLARGVKTSIKAEIDSKDYGDVWTFKQNGDIITTQRVLVHERRQAFNSAEDFGPRGELYVCPTSIWEYPAIRKPAAFVHFNRDRDRIAIVQGDTSPHWTRRERSFFAPAKIVQVIPFAGMAELEELADRFQEALGHA